jgi:hypothetical protein
LSERGALRAGETAPTTSKPPAPRLDDDRDRGRVLGCAFCRRPITTAAAAIEVGGAHAHSFTNPDGISFRVGCFSDAAGLLKHGPSTLDWTWFEGYSWQVEICAGCREQLGWLYRSRDQLFHGLILDNLVEVQAS